MDPCESPDVTLVTQDHVGEGFPAPGPGRLCVGIRFVRNRFQKLLYIASASRTVTYRFISSGFGLL